MTGDQVHTPGFYWLREEVGHVHRRRWVVVEVFSPGYEIGLEVMFVGNDTVFPIGDVTGNFLGPIEEPR